MDLKTQKPLRPNDPRVVAFKSARELVPVLNKSEAQFYATELKKAAQTIRRLQTQAEMYSNALMIIAIHGDAAGKHAIEALKCYQLWWHQNKRFELETQE